MGFDADLLVPAGTHDLSKAGGIVPVGRLRNRGWRHSPAERQFPRLILLNDRPHAGARRGTAMNQYAALDVSLEQTAICVVDETGRKLTEVKVVTCPHAISTRLRRPRRVYVVVKENRTARLFMTA